MTNRGFRIKRWLVGLSVSVCVIFLFILIHFLWVPLVTDERGVRYTVVPGATFSRVTEELYQRRIISHPTLFYLYVLIHQGKSKLKAGEYLFPKGTTVSGLYQQLTLAKGLIQSSFTIIPGWTFAELKEALLQQPDLMHTAENLSDDAILQALQMRDVSPEGQFFPDTYYFTKDSSDIMLLKRAFKRMQDKLTVVWQNRDPDLPFKTMQEALVAASLVEKEAYFENERPIIAGILINRLEKNMLLQFDPTVIYGLGARYQGTISKNDLLIDSPYNTYKYKGLPPTPIAIPSLNSIMAVLHPLHHDFLYFVAKGDHSHQFSVTLLEHNVAVATAKQYRPPFFNQPLMQSYLWKYLYEGKVYYH